MRKFKVLDVKESITKCEMKKRKTADGNWVTFPVYREVKRGEEGWYPGAYGHEDIHKGDVIELDGHLADKCAANPQFEEVFDEPEPVKKKVAKKKPGRPKKKVA